MTMTLVQDEIIVDSQVPLGRALGLGPLMGQDSQGRTVWNTIDDPAGDPPVGAPVRIILYGGGQIPGYVGVIPKEILGDWNAVTDSNGKWQLDLIPNSLIFP